MHWDPSSKNPGLRAEITPGLHFAILWRCHRGLRGPRLSRRPWQVFNESDPGPLSGVMRQKNRYTASCVLINIRTFLLSHNKRVLINVLTFFRKKEDCPNQKQRRKRRRRFLSRRKPKIRRRGASRSLRGRRGRSRSTNPRPQHRVRATRTPTCPGCPRRSWTCRWTPTSPPTASATRCLLERWLGATTTTVPSSGSTSGVWTSPPSPRGSGIVPGVRHHSRRNDDRGWVGCWCTNHQYLF